MTVPAGRRVHLVRHGETEAQSSIRFWGRTDVPLSHEGRAQVQRLAAAVGPLHVDLVVYSPLSRAAESARILSRALAIEHVPARADAALTEIDFGAFEGLTREEIAARDPVWFASWERSAHVGFPGGDSIAAFAMRVRLAFAKVMAESTGDVLVVAHRGVIRHIADAVVAGAGSAPTDLASLSTLRLDPPGVERWNVRGGRQD